MAEVDLSCFVTAGEVAAFALAICFFVDLTLMPLTMILRNTDTTDDDNDELFNMTDLTEATTIGVAALRRLDRKLNRRYCSTVALLLSDIV